MLLKLPETRVRRMLVLVLPLSSFVIAAIENENLGDDSDEEPSFGLYVLFLLRRGPDWCIGLVSEYRAKTVAAGAGPETKNKATISKAIKNVDKKEDEPDELDKRAIKEKAEKAKKK